jgi:putative SOS response-associated peptidase YedK
MCGRYSYFSPIEKAEKALKAKAIEWQTFEPKYNAAPTQYMPVVTNEFPDVIQYMRWGLIPQWAKDMAIGSKMINTRSESIDEKPAWKNIFKYKRCVVIADGYYEWKKEDQAKIPFRMHRPNNELLFFAGLWDVWSGTGDGLYSFSIITTPSNADTKHIHERMPVLLTLAEAKQWLSKKESEENLLKILKTPEAGQIECYTVSSLVNTTYVDDPRIIEPHVYPPTIKQGKLF